MMMAMLLAVMAPLRSTTVTANNTASLSTQAEFEQLEHQASMLQSERSRLTSAIADLQQWTTNASDNKMGELEEQWSSLRVALRSVEGQYDAALAELSKETAANTTTQQSVDSAAGELVQAEERYAKVANLLEDAVKERRQSVSLPRVRSSEKNNELTLLKFGRLYTVHRQDDDSPGEINERDLEVTRFLGITHVTPRPGRGWDLVDENQRRAAFYWLKLLDADSKSITVGVFQDSFGDFQKLKEMLVSLSLEYELVPLDTDDPVSVGTRSGGLRVQ